MFNGHKILADFSFVNEFQNSGLSLDIKTKINLESVKHLAL